MLCDVLEEFGVTLTKLRTISVKNKHVFAWEKLTKGLFVKAETKTSKATLFLSSISVQLIPVSSLARSTGATCYGGTAQSQAEIHVYRCL